VVADLLSARPISKRRHLERGHQHRVAGAVAHHQLFHRRFGGTCTFLPIWLAARPCFAVDSVREALLQSAQLTMEAFDRSHEWLCCDRLAFDSCAKQCHTSRHRLRVIGTHQFVVSVTRLRSTSKTGPESAKELDIH